MNTDFSASRKLNQNSFLRPTKAELDKHQSQSMGVHSAKYFIIPYFRGLLFINLVNKFKPYGIPISSHF